VDGGWSGEDSNRQCIAKTDGIAGEVCEIGGQCCEAVNGLAIGTSLGGCLGRVRPVATGEVRWASAACCAVVAILFGSSAGAAAISSPANKPGSTLREGAGLRPCRAGRQPLCAFRFLLRRFPFPNSCAHPHLQIAYTVT
jgi:hypothetical protein